MKLLKQKRPEIDKIIYIENDVIPYVSINEMFEKFDKVYGGKIVFSPYCPEQLSCCFMYIGSNDSLNEFCKAILYYFHAGIKWVREKLPTQEIINETCFAYLFWKDKSEITDLFPTMPVDAFNEHFNKLGFFIDPMGYGQWLGGRRVNPGIPYANRNDWIGRELLDKKISVNKVYEKCPVINNEYPLATLHMHCKRNLDKWI